MTPASIDTEPVQRNKIVVSDRCGKGKKNPRKWFNSGSLRHKNRPLTRSSEESSFQVFKKKEKKMINFWIVFILNLDAFYKNNTLLLPCWEESERAEASM